MCFYKTTLHQVSLTDWTSATRLRKKQNSCHISCLLLTEVTNYHQVIHNRQVVPLHTLTIHWGVGGLSSVLLLSLNCVQSIDYGCLDRMPTTLGEALEIIYSFSGYFCYIQSAENTCTEGQINSAQLACKHSTLVYVSITQTHTCARAHAHTQFDSKCLYTNNLPICLPM